jgi:hypothetical protein
LYVTVPETGTTFEPLHPASRTHVSNARAIARGMKGLDMEG